MTRRDPFAALRPHELRVLYYAARGLSNAAIGRLLGCSVQHVKNARHTAYGRLGAVSGLDAILMLLRAAQRVQEAQGGDDGLPAPRAPRDRAA